MNEIEDAMIYRLIVQRNIALGSVINFSAKRITYNRFHPGTGHIKYPVNPVNPVYIIN
jgi:hypothetical protein